MPVIPGLKKGATYVKGNIGRANVKAKIMSKGNQAAAEKAYEDAIRTAKKARTPVGKATATASNAADAVMASNTGGIAALAQFNRRAKYGAGAGLAASVGAFQKKPNESRTSYRGPGRSVGLRNPSGTGRYAG